MVSTNDILETIKMIQEENLDIRTITMGISLLDCIDSDIDRACGKVYEKMMRAAENHVYPPLHRPARKNQGKSNKTQPSPRCPSAPFSLVLHAGSQRTSRRR